MSQTLLIDWFGKAESFLVVYLKTSSDNFKAFFFVYDLTHFFYSLYSRYSRARFPFESYRVFRKTKKRLSICGKRKAERQSLHTRARQLLPSLNRTAFIKANLNHTKRPPENANIAVARPRHSLSRVPSVPLVPAVPCVLTKLECPPHRTKPCRTCSLTIVRVSFRAKRSASAFILSKSVRPSVCKWFR